MELKSPFRIMSGSKVITLLQTKHVAEKKENLFSNQSVSPAPNWPCYPINNDKIDTLIHHRHISVPSYTKWPDGCVLLTLITVFQKYAFTDYHRTIQTDPLSTKTCCLFHFTVRQIRISLPHKSYALLKAIVINGFEWIKSKGVGKYHPSWRYRIANKELSLITETASFEGNQQKQQLKFISRVTRGEK